MSRIILISFEQKIEEKNAQTEAEKKERLEKEIMEKQKDLIATKNETLQLTKRVEELYSNAIAAMKSYSGADEDDVYV